MDYISKKTMKPSPEVFTLSDSEEEIFVGPVTDKEKEKAAKLSRRTQVFFPPISWKLRSSNHSVKEPKESTMFQQSSSTINIETSNLNRAQSLFEEKEPSFVRYDGGKHTPNLQKPDSDSNRESPSNGYTADISSAEKTNYPISEADSLECGNSADSLNSLSRDSLDVDHDSLEENKIKDINPGCDSHDTSIVQDLYDAGKYLNVHQVEQNVNFTTPQKQFTPGEIEELQKQLDQFAMEIRKEENGGEESSEKHNNSFETEDITTETESPVIRPNIESIFTSDQNLPSPYDLDKQRLSAVLPNDSIDVTYLKDRLDTVTEISEPSSRDINSRLSGLQSLEEFPNSLSPSPKKNSTDYLPNSTQMFEELEKQFEEEDSFHLNHQTTDTVLPESEACSMSCENIPDATFTVISNATVNPYTDAEYASSLNSSYHDSPTGNNVSSDSPPEGTFNDTLEEMEMLLKYGVDYIYGTHGRTEEQEVSYQEPVAQEVCRPKSADSCDSHHSGRSIPGTRDKAAKAPTPMKRVPLTPSKTQSKVYHTPVKTPTSSVISDENTQRNSASKLARGSQRTATPRSAPTRSTKLNEPASKKNLYPMEKTPKFKVPAKIPVPTSRTPRSVGAATAVMYSPRQNKFLNQIQSPIGAYIHNSPSPVLMTNIKPKACSTTPRDHDARHRPVWDGMGSRNHKVEGSENINPNVGHSLRAVHYIQAPCVKLDDHSLPKSRLPRLGDRFEKLLDSPCPQVIKHEGRVRVNPSSPQYTAAVKAVRSNLNDSTRSVAAAGDISVCVSKVAKRTNTLSVDH